MAADAKDRITERAKDICVELRNPVSNEEWGILIAMHWAFGGDCVVDEVLDLFDARHARGMETYGVSLSDAVLTESECIQHLREELADALKYAIKLDEIRKAKENPNG